VNKSRPPGKLKQRVLTALVLLPLIVAAMIYLPSSWLGVVLGVFILVGAWEWAALSGLQALSHRIIYVMLLGIMAGITSVAIWRFPALAIAITAVAAIWWVWAFFDLVRRAEGSSGMFHSMIGRLIGGAFVLVPAWLAAVYLHRIDPISPAILLFFFALVWIADTSAYFVGKTWGKTRLAPRVSAGKTVEGLCGALMAVILLAYFCGVMIWELQGLNLFAWVVVAVCASLFSVLGDLVESKQGMKA
jgi:phosphatidate cytidylyltransferase